MNIDTMQLVNFGWSIALALGCWGIGNPIAKKLKAPGWAAAPIGLAAIILIAGWLDLAHIAGRMTMTLIGLGAIAAGLIQFKDLIASAKSVGKSGVWVGVISAAGVAWYGSGHNQLLTNWDDASGYLPICHELSAHGNSWAALSWRRALSWGGQFPIQNLGMLFTADYGAYVYEKALGTWLWAGIGIAIGKSIGGWRGATVALITPMLPHTSVNSAPHATVALMVITAWTLRQHAIMFGLLAAAAMALRLQAVPMMGLLALWTFWEKGKDVIMSPFTKPNHRVYATPAIQWGWQSALALSIALAPFILNHIAQFKTPLPMLWAGTIDPAYLTPSEASIWVHLGNLVKMGFALTIPLFILAWGVSNKETRGICAAAILVTIYFVTGMAEFSAGEWVRYTWPIILAATLLILQTSKKETWTAWLAIIGITTIPTIEMIKTVRANEMLKDGAKISSTVTNQTLQSVDALERWAVDPEPNKKGDEKYFKKPVPTEKIVEEGFTPKLAQRAVINTLSYMSLPEIQKNIPEGKSVAVILLQPNHLIFSRNKIINLDEFGAIGNIPTNPSLEDWKKWGKETGADYLLFNDFRCKHANGKTILRNYLTPSNKGTDLKHYQRVYTPRKTTIITALVEICKDAEWEKRKMETDGFVILNLGDLEEN